MNHQHHILQFFGLNQTAHVGNMGLKRNICPQQVSSVAYPGECHRMATVSSVTETLHHPLPTPSAMPRPVNQDKVRHFFSSNQDGLKLSR
jgi:hypothetical protein